jgi:LexA-binding, inner membrane-associated putative hydrolase
MPNRDVHLRVGAVSGTAYAAYHAWEQPGPCMLAEAAGGLVGGIGGGLLPDWIDTPCSPRHRAEAHSMSITGTVGYYMNQQLSQWQANLRAEAKRCAQLSAASTSVLPQIGYSALEFIFRFLSGLLAGLLAGYASHLALDSLTPSSLPVLC